MAQLLLPRMKDKQVGPWMEVATMVKMIGLWCVMVASEGCEIEGGVC